MTGGEAIRRIWMEQLHNTNKDENYSLKRAVSMLFSMKVYCIQSTYLTEKMVQGILKKN